MADVDPPTWLAAWQREPRESIPPEAIRPPTPSPDRGTVELPHRGIGDPPHVSVIVPTYGDDGFLPDALWSVATQTVASIEVVIVDSSGKDWLAALGDEHAWIRHVRAPPSGVAAARNVGVEAAAGEYLAFLDADDYWHPRKLERQLEAMEGAADTSFTGYHFLNYWREGDPRISRRDTELVRPSDAARAVVRRACDAHASTLVCRSSVVSPAPFDEGLTNFEDVRFAIECFHDHPPAHVPAPLAVRRLRPDSLADRTGDVEKAQDRIAVYRSLADRYPTFAGDATEMIALQTHRIGIAHLRAGEIPAARRYFRESIAHHPRPWRPHVLLWSTYLPIDTARTVDRLTSLASG